jgi:serine/threonine protein kinase
MYEMCTFTKPFEGNSIHFLALKIIKGKYKKISPTVYSLNLRSLVESLLTVDPIKRPTIDEVVSKSSCYCRENNLFVDSASLEIRARRILRSLSLSLLALLASQSN